MSQLTRHRTPDGELDLGDLITAAIGLDRSWVSHAACLAWTHDDKPTPWQVDKSQVIDGVRGSEMIKMALMVCATCQAQYDCARYAVQGQMRAGTWAMGITNLSWLQNTVDPLTLIEIAEAAAQPLHTFVTALRLSD